MTDTEKLIAEIDVELSKYVVDLATAPLDDLVRRYMAGVEMEGEEASQDVARSYRRQVAMIEAIGRFRFWSQFEDAINKAAGE